MQNDRYFLKRSGQVIVFLLMALVILCFVILWSVDVHRMIFVKDRSQNAGDAAALAAARWQASSLNLVGELNLFHAIALADGDFAAVEMITNTQARLCYTGPMTGMVAAQLAAKLNGIHNNDEFAEFLHTRADIVRNDYTRDIGGEMLFPEPYPGAWREYADMMDAVADDGVAAGADNSDFYTDYSGGHILLLPEFYDAIAGKNWCWFFLNQPNLLEDYTGYTWWPALPQIDNVSYNDCELFPLKIQPITGYLSMMISSNALAESFQEENIEMPDDPESRWRYSPETWYAYNSFAWGEWNALDAPFPIEGKLKGEYNYAGADVVTRIYATVDRLSPDAAANADMILWTAAAKPFGYIESDSERHVPSIHHLVLPAFRNVALIPIDASSAGNGGGSFDIKWRRHIEEHLPQYMLNGPGAGNPACGYCSRLVTWEKHSFREEGIHWLSENSEKCTLPPPHGGGGGPGGGTRRPH